LTRRWYTLFDLCPSIVTTARPNPVLGASFPFFPLSTDIFLFLFRLLILCGLSREPVFFVLFSGLVSFFGPLTFRGRWPGRRFGDVLVVYGLLNVSWTRVCHKIVADFFYTVLSFPCYLEHCPPFAGDANIASPFQSWPFFFLIFYFLDSRVSSLVFFVSYYS